MALNIVRLEPGYFPNPDIGRPISNAQIFVGIIDLDPEIEANRKTISLQQEDGTIVPIAPASQPIRTGAGGVPIFNGSPVTILVDGNYSLKVLSSSGSQIYNIPNVANFNANIVVNVANITELKGITGSLVDDVVNMSARTTIGDGGDGTFTFLDGNQSANPAVLADTLEGVYVKPATPGDGSTGVWVRQHKGTISPQWFGAKTDGTDSATEWQAALDFVFASTFASGLLGHNEAPFFPTVIDGDGKVYGIATKLELPSGAGVLTENAHFRGISPFTGDNLLELGLRLPFLDSDQDYKNSHITFQNITWDANHISGVGCVKAKAFYVLTFDNCRFFRSPTHGLHTFPLTGEQSHELKIRGCNLREWLEFEEPGFSTPGIRTGTGLRIETQDTVISDTECGFWDRPFRFVNAKGMTASNFHPYGGEGFILGNSGTDLVDRMSYTGCFFDNMQLSLQDVADITFTGNNFFQADSPAQFISVAATGSTPDINFLMVGNNFTAPNHTTTAVPVVFGGSLGTVNGYMHSNTFDSKTDFQTFWGTETQEFDYKEGTFTPAPIAGSNVTSIGSVSKAKFTQAGRVVFYSFKIASVQPTATGIAKVTFTPPVPQSSGDDVLAGMVHSFGSVDVGHVLDVSSVSDNVFEAVVNVTSTTVRTWIISGQYQLD